MVVCKLRRSRNLHTTMELKALIKKKAHNLLDYYPLV